MQNGHFIQERPRVKPIINSPIPKNMPALAPISVKNKILYSGRHEVSNQSLRTNPNIGDRYRRRKNSHANKPLSLNKYEQKLVSNGQRINSSAASGGSFQSEKPRYPFPTVPCIENEFIPEKPRIKKPPVFTVKLASPRPSVSYEIPQEMEVDSFNGQLARYANSNSFMSNSSMDSALRNIGSIIRNNIPSDHEINSLDSSNASLLANELQRHMQQSNNFHQ